MNNDNRGSISKNKRKEQDKHPDYRGSAYHRRQAILGVGLDQAQGWRVILVYVLPDQRRTGI